jgi:pyruvate kinase
MSQLKFAKIWVTVSSAIAKETVLSKIINMVNVFRIDVANKPFDDTQKKYIDTILKLDDSKTIVLETKGEQITSKNLHSPHLVVGQQFTIEYSQISEESNEILFINYSHLSQVPVGSSLTFEGSSFYANVIGNYDGVVTCVVKEQWEISHNSKIVFIDYIPKISFLSEKDKKDIIRWVQSGVNLLAASSVKNHYDVVDIKNFLAHNVIDGVKLYTRLSFGESYEDLERIITVSDGIVLDYLVIDPMDDTNEVITMITMIKKHGKPIILCINHNDIMNETEFVSLITYYMNLWVDLVMIGDDITEQALPVEALQHIITTLWEAETQTMYTEQFQRFAYVSEQTIDESNYMVSILPKIIQDVDVKAIVCYTNLWQTAAKISSLKLAIPSIVFTKNDYVYRYNNLLRGVKGYKIWQTSHYAQFKQIAKEMIRMHFKWNISLDDKVLLVSLYEWQDQSVLADGMINGIEIYKFKNI